MTCWECGSDGPLHNHHPVPRSRGGTRTIPLCESCHGKAHHRDRAMSTSALTRAAMRAKRARGERTGEVPFGFTADAEGKLHPNPEEQAVVDAAREFHRAGMSQRAIVAELAERGFTGRTGRALQRTQVRRILAA